MQRRSVVLPSIALLIAMLVTSVDAVHAEEGITVTGTGEVKAKPTQVEIGALIVGEAELANDAIVKYRDARKRAVAALEGMKNPNLKIESGGYSIQQAIDPNQAQMMMQGRSAGVAKPKVQVTETLKIVLLNAEKSQADQLIDDVLKVIDTGRDAGLQVGSSTPQNYYQMQMMMQSGQGQNMCTFKIANPAAQREQAYKAAMDDARTKASRLAELAGVKLGRILSVQDAMPMKNDNQQMAYMMMINGMGVQTDPADLTSALFTDIPMKVNLNVHFEIQK